MRFFSKKIFIFLVTIFIALFLVLLQFKGFFYAPTNHTINSLSYVGQPLWKLSVKFFGIFDFFVDLKNIYSDNEKLKSENLDLLAENFNWSELLREKDFLEEARKLQINDGYDWQVGNIVGMDLQNWASFMLINIGSDNGISIDMPVITEKRIVIGRIAEVGKDYSKIATIFNPGQKIAIKTKESSAFGILEGNYSRNLSIDFIEKEKHLVVDEEIFTSGKDGIYPPGLIIGKLKDFKSKPEQLFQTANAVSVLDIYDLERVLVITKF